MTISELAEKFGVSQSVIYGIWQRGGLPTDKLLRRNRKITSENKKMIRRFFKETEMTDLEIADKMMIVKRLITKLRKQVQREKRIKG